MITQLQIKNFKGWKDTGVIRTAPITLFFGGNSSGKSSIGHFLLMLKQTAQSLDRKSAIQTHVSGSPVNFGSYRDIVFGRKRGEQIEFSIEWKTPEPLRLENALSQKSWKAEDLRFDCALRAATKAPHQAIVGKFLYTALDAVPLKGKRVKRPWQLGLELKTGSESSYEAIDGALQLVGRMGRPAVLGTPNRFYGFPDEFFGYYQNAQSGQDLSLELDKLLRGVAYLGPLRIHPERVYPWLGNAPESVGYDGRETVSALLSGKERRYSFKKGGHGRRLDEIIATKLQELGLIHSFAIRPLSEHNTQQYEVKLRVHADSEEVDLPDVGFGISQVLPVLVQLYYAPANSIIVIEQPELHLHPRAQSLLADVLIDVLACREDGEKRNIQLFIETHSEHLLVRLQRRIAERAGKLKPDQMAAYVATSQGGSSQLSALEINEFGQIANWPDNFFGDQMSDLVAISQAAAGV